MAFGDRMTIEIKNFGRIVHIRIKRGKVEINGQEQHAKEIVVQYKDAPVRAKPKGSKGHL